MIMIDDVVARLLQFGYVSENDTLMISYIIGKTERFIKDTCNISSVPESLISMGTDRVCGEFLLLLKNSGQDVGIDIGAAVSTISEGDTNVSFAIGSGSNTPEQRLDILIDYLINGHNDGLSCVRKLRW